jgi:hypothetical protein
VSDKEAARPQAARVPRRHRFVTQANGTGYIDIIDTAREKPEGMWIARVWDRPEAQEIARLLNRHSMSRFLGRGNNARRSRQGEGDDA